MSGHEQAPERLPAVLFVHGGFEMGAADWDMALPYWEAGFVLVLPMLRGENGERRDAIKRRRDALFRSTG